MAYSLCVASCFLFCASAIQDVVHIHRKASQIPNIQSLIDTAMDTLDDVVTDLDKVIKVDTELFTGVAKVDKVFTDHANDMIKDLAVSSNPTGFRPYISALQGAQLVVSDTADMFHQGVATIETHVTDALNDLSAAGLDTAQKALSELNDALEPLKAAEVQLNKTRDALAVSMDEKQNANSVQGPLQDAIKAAAYTMQDLAKSTEAEISDIFDQIVDEAGNMPESVQKAKADTIQLVDDMKALVKGTMDYTQPAMQEIKDFTWQAAHMGANLPPEWHIGNSTENSTESAAEGSRCFSAAVGGVVLMALTAATA